MKKEKWIQSIRESEDSEFIDAVLEAALIRKRELYPEWDIAYLAMEKERDRGLWEKIYAIMNSAAAGEENAAPGGGK